MITVKVTRTVHRPAYQVFTAIVVLPAFDRLIPAAAVMATRIAYGNRGGTVYGDAYGYKVYTHSTRRFNIPR